MENVLITRPRVLWGNKVSLVILFVFQVLAIIVLISGPFLMNDWDLASDLSLLTGRWYEFYIPYSLGIIFLASSFWVFSQRRNDFVGQTYSIFATSTSISLFCLFDVFTGQSLFSIWVVSIAISGGSLINLALNFPEQASIKINHPSSRYLGYLPSAVLFLISLLVQFLSGNRNYSSTIFVLGLIFITLTLSFFLVSTVIRRFGSSSPMVRDQARYILWGCMIALCPVIAWFVWNWRFADNELPPVLLLTISAFPISLTYTLLRYRIRKSNALLKQSIIYGSLLVLISGSYALLVGGISVLAGMQLNKSHPILVGLVVFVIALLVYPLRKNLQSRLDIAFFKAGNINQNNLQKFGHELTRLTDVQSIFNLLRNYVDESLSPSKNLIFRIDETNTYYISAEDTHDSPGSEIHFARSGSLVGLLSKQGNAIHLGDSSKLPEELLVDQARIAVLQAELFVPISGQSGMIGWLALGHKRSGEPYSSQDIFYLESLCDQTSLALERSQVISALEKRVHEMDTITKVAEQINQKLVLDDLLDMFYQETRNLVPTVDFRITLKSGAGDDYYHVFYVSDNKRITRRENQPFYAQQSLETVVIEKQHPIVTVDYSSECRRRGITLESQAINAWMSVPLNAGEGTIGAVCIGSRDPAIIYSPEDVDLLQAVADQVAGAIVKTRLLDESQKQARQMAALNDLTRSLTSTLELKPLLNHITQGAVEILDCEAGSLLLIDESTSEPVFEVVIGPVASDLIGTRLPPGTGLVGKAIENKRGLIRNDVRSSADWFNADDSTGFSSKDMLVVPLVIQELAIGVLEVLNKVDGSPFNQSDLELLTAFAGQMAVAIENARLYTQTDQALASRLNELSIMQQIDKELNATLDVHQVMSITLAAAMRYSESSAGLIGTVEPDGLKIIAKDGFPIDHLGMVEIAGISKLPGIDQVICESSTGSANRPHSQYGDNIVYLQGEKDLKDKSELLSTLPGQTDQILVRIKIDQDIKGIIFLVSTKPSGFSTDNLDFLNRLSDHSAIAVSNAQLYARVRAANEAKSEFVSAAAHELKNPLTSIKGYSDLLVAGSVGPVSEKQAEFLSTIRANAERMRTLVSDLQDISRIEADQLLLQIEEQCLPDLIQEVVASIETQITKKHQRLLVVVPENPDLVRCDNTRTIQILTNLVSNANKYSPQGSKIEIRVDPMIISEDSDVDQKMMKISVIDNGFGIGEEDQKLIFEQFFRSEDSHVRESTGTGLGLSITKKLVELQGGEIWFESELGKGTSFYFTLPTAIHTGN